MFIDYVVFDKIFTDFRDNLRLHLACIQETWLFYERPHTAMVQLRQYRSGLIDISLAALFHLERTIYPFLILLLIHDLTSPNFNLSTALLARRSENSLLGLQV